MFIHQTPSLMNYQARIESKWHSPRCNLKPVEMLSLGFVLGTNFQLVLHNTTRLRCTQVGARLGTLVYLIHQPQPARKRNFIFETVKNYVQNFNCKLLSGFAQSTLHFEPQERQFSTSL